MRLQDARSEERWQEGWREVRDVLTGTAHVQEGEQKSSGITNHGNSVIITTKRFPERKKTKNNYWGWEKDLHNAPRNGTSFYYEGDDHEEREGHSQNSGEETRERWW